MLKNIQNFRPFCNFYFGSFIKPIKIKMQTTNTKFNKWYNYSYALESAILTNTQIELALNALKGELIPSLHHHPDFLDLKVLILFKIKTVNNQKRTISYMQSVNIKDFDILNSIFVEFWNLRSEDYYLSPLASIIFNYKIIYSKQPTKLLTVKSKINISKRVTTESAKFGGFKLPNTMDFTNWGGGVKN